MRDRRAAGARARTPGRNAWLPIRPAYKPPRGAADGEAFADWCSDHIFWHICPALDTPPPRFDPPAGD
ncbi:MAG: hypothetical protein PHN77_05270, partial [Thermoguttaceae bacterium]|nr:hypothetical protein [Thermoguttaceae bacterium]